MTVVPCRSYHAKVVERHMVAMPDGKSRFKAYFVSIVGRDEPSRYEWAHCGATTAAFLSRFAAGGDEGVGFVTAFPHITKVFRFCPDAEILMVVRAFQTATFAPLSLERVGGFTEFACYAEALIAADEYRVWAAAPSVEAYLAEWSGALDAPITDHTKLRVHWGSR